MATKSVSTTTSSIPKATLNLIDLSYHNGNVNFSKVKSAGIDGVIIRTGYGIESPRQKDSKFEKYYTDAKAVGLYVGAYHYSYAQTADEAKNEAKFMLKILKGKSFELPIYGDFEEQTECSKTVCCDIVKTFCNYLEDAGAWAGLYSYDSFFSDKLTKSIPTRYTAWIAHVENIYPKYVTSGNIGIWQYSWKGKINGVNGEVDMDYCYKDFPKLIAKAGLNKF